MVVAAVAVLVLSACGPGVFTHAGNDGRTAWYSDQTGLTPQLVGGGTFGQMFASPVDGQVYAQPVISNGSLLVATEKNNIYGIDAVTGARQWTRNVGVRTDRALVLGQAGVAVPSTFRLGFAGSSGRLTDLHMVNTVSITTRS